MPRTRRFTECGGIYVTENSVILPQTELDKDTNLTIDAYLDQQTNRKQPNMATGDVLQDHDSSSVLPQYEVVGSIADDSSNHGDGLDNVNELLENRSTGRFAVLWKLFSVLEVVKMFGCIHCSLYLSGFMGTGNIEFSVQRTGACKGRSGVFDDQSLIFVPTCS